MRTSLLTAFVMLTVACAGAAVGPAGTTSAVRQVAYRAKSGDVDPIGNYRVRLTGPNGRREADLWVWLKVDGTGYGAVIQFDGQNAIDSLSVRVDGKRVRLEVRADDRWARRNLPMGSTASGKAPDIPLTPPVLSLLFDGRNFTGTWRWQGKEETVEGRPIPER